MESLQQNEAVNSFVSEDIQSALAKIDSMYRVPFMMYFEGFKYHEISEHLNIPIGTVKTRIHVARKLMKRSLSAYKVA
jgi:RNA polymerase sigma-70 factor (ECF subfamily)